MQQLRLTDYSDELSLGQHLEKHSNGPEKITHYGDHVHAIRQGKCATSKCTGKTAQNM